MFTDHAISTFGSGLLAVAFIGVWIAIAFRPARIGRRHRRRFIGDFIFSLFFSPLALLTSYLVDDRKPGRGAPPRWACFALLFVSTWL